MLVVVASVVEVELVGGCVVSTSVVGGLLWVVEGADEEPGSEHAANTDSASNNATLLATPLPEVPRASPPGACRLAVSVVSVVSPSGLGRGLERRRILPAWHEFR